MTALLATIIIMLGIINVLRMSILFILGDWYDAYYSLWQKRPLQSAPWVTVLIPAHNEEKNIVATIDSVYKSSYRRFRVVVIDDGSTDQTRARVVAYKRKQHLKTLRLLHQKNSGKAHALNYALKKAGIGELVMTLDADSLLGVHSLEKAVHYFEKNNVAAVASNVRILKEYTLLGSIQYIEYLLGHRLKKAYTVLNNEYIIGGIGATFRRDVLKKVGFYDTNTITEDIDLTMKIVAKSNRKYRVIFGSDVLCYTQGVPSLTALFRQRFRWKYGRFQTLYKNLQLFFNTSSRYTRLLTFIQLPFVIYSESAFLFDPIFLGLVVYFMYLYRDVESLQWIFLFLGFYTTVSIVTDEYSSTKEKLRYLLLAPLAYLWFFTVSIIEYVCLICCLFQWRGIIDAVKLNRCTWAHVQRIPRSALVTN